MKLKIPKNHGYTKEQVELLKPYLNKTITLEQLITLPVAVAIDKANCTPTVLSIDHPHSW